MLKRIEVKVSRTIYIELDVDENASINAMSKEAFDKFVETQENWEESEQESFEWKFMKAPKI
jgi:hypothetical protein